MTLDAISFAVTSVLALTHIRDIGCSVSVDDLPETPGGVIAPATQVEAQRPERRHVGGTHYLGVQLPNRQGRVTQHHKQVKNTTDEVEGQSPSFVLTIGLQCHI